MSFSSPYAKLSILDAYVCPVYAIDDVKNRNFRGNKLQQSKMFLRYNFPQVQYPENYRKLSPTLRDFRN